MGEAASCVVQANASSPAHSADLGAEAPSRSPRQDPQLISDEVLDLFAESWELARDGPLRVKSCHRLAGSTHSSATLPAHLSKPLRGALGKGKTQPNGLRGRHGVGVSTFGCPGCGFWWHKAIERGAQKSAAAAALILYINPEKVDVLTITTC